MAHFPTGSLLFVCNLIAVPIGDYDSEVADGSGVANGARAILMHAHTPCQSRSDR